jgi:uracil-DNA glycosylase family 4
VSDSLKKLNRDIIACVSCPRLRQYCKSVAQERKKSHRHETYWGKPVPDFGSERAALLIVGLAPAAHGANRTGRMFTGDRSGQWLYRALHKAGFANQPTFESADDGLILIDCAVTATVHCAPPANKPTPSEIKECNKHITRSIDVHHPRVILALGAIAWQSVFKQAKSRGWWTRPTPKFGHAAEAELTSGPWVLASYHPSQQNTFTGKLTEPMFDRVFARARLLIDA